MKLHLVLLGAVLCVLFSLAPAFDFGEFLDKFMNHSEQFNAIRSKLRRHSIKLREALNETRGRWAELDRDNDDLFDVAVSELGVKIRNSTDRSFKRKWFSRNLQSAAHLTEKHKNAVFGVTPFSFIDLEDFKKDYLMKPMQIQDLPTDGAVRAEPTRAKRAASNVDLRSARAVAPIRNQGQCGSCWSFATASTMETSYYQKTRVMKDLSEQQFVNCDATNNGCNGGWMSKAYTYAQDGIALESTNPYVGLDKVCGSKTGSLVKVSNYTQLWPEDAAGMRAYLSRGYSLAVAIKAGTPEMKSYTGGILDDPTDCPDNTVDHAVVIVGYGTENGVDYWIVRNSWGTYWGEQGYFRVQAGINYCNIEYYPFFVDVLV